MMSALHPEVDVTDHALIRAYLAATETPPLPPEQAERFFSDSKLTAVRTVDGKSYARWFNAASSWAQSSVHA